MIYIYTLGVKDIRHGRNLPISFTVFAFEVEPMFLNLSEPESFWNTPTIFSCVTTILHSLPISAQCWYVLWKVFYYPEHNADLLYQKYFLPIAHLGYEKSRINFWNFWSKSVVNGYNPFLLVRKCNIAYKKVRHHGMKIIIFGKTWEISVSCSILELPVVPIDDANSISFTVW